MKAIGQFPTPYGVSVPVYFDRARHVDENECYFHDIDGCMTLAGIHGESNRRRCRKEVETTTAKGGFAFDIFLKHGGRKAPYIGLESPVNPVYPRLPRALDIDIPVENWVTLVMEHARWNTRADVLLEIVASNLDNSETWDMPQEIHALALAQMLTASLEHLTETEIDCVEAAAMYALTLHYREWSAPAVEWLMPFRDTWFRDWTGRHRHYVRFARLMRIINPELPIWIDGGAK